MEKYTIDNLKNYCSAVMLSMGAISIHYKMNDLSRYLFLHQLLLDELNKETPNETICDYLGHQIPLEMDRVKNLQLKSKYSSNGYAIVDELKPEVYTDSKGNIITPSVKNDDVKPDVQLEYKLRLEQLEKEMKRLFNQ